MRPQHAGLRARQHEPRQLGRRGRSDASGDAGAQPRPAQRRRGRRAVRRPPRRRRSTSRPTASARPRRSPRRRAPPAAPAPPPAPTPARRGSRRYPSMRTVSRARWMRRSWTLYSSGIFSSSVIASTSRASSSCRRSAASARVDELLARLERVVHAEQAADVVAHRYLSFSKISTARTTRWSVFSSPASSAERDDVARELLLHQQGALGNGLDLIVGLLVVVASEHLAQQFAHPREYRGNAAVSRRPPPSVLGPAG